MTRNVALSKMFLMSHHGFRICGRAENSRELRSDGGLESSASEHLWRRRRVDKLRKTRDGPTPVELA